MLAVAELEQGNVESAYEVRSFASSFTLLLALALTISEPCLSLYFAFAFVACCSTSLSSPNRPTHPPPPTSTSPNCPQLPKPL